jgi:hypothetical protein
VATLPETKHDSKKEKTMLNKKMTLACCLILTTFTTHAAETERTPASIAPNGEKKSHKTFVLTDEEKKIVEEARKAFDRDRHLPPPSKHLQHKMDSSQAE